MSSVYDLIKKQNGEAFAKSIREYDNSLFELPEIVFLLKYAGRQAEPILFFLEALKIKNMEPAKQACGDLFFLAHQKGYQVIVADDLKKQNLVRPFFKKEEALCTFKDETRFQRYYILYFIKNEAEKLNREDFLMPSREDEYGSSVMSIQILKTGGFIKITNRYNHAVKNPDNTFYSNPDYIVPGLSSAIKEFFGVDFQISDVEVPDGFIFLQNRLLKYHFETGNVFYGDGFYLKDGQLVEIQKDYQLLADNFILDFKENKLICPHEADEEAFPEDVFLTLVKKEIEGKKLSIKKEEGKHLVFADNNLILKVKNSHVVYADLKMPLFIERPLFVHHPWIEEVYLNNLKSFAPGSFSSCPKLRCLGLKKALFVPSHAIRDLPLLEVLDLSFVQKVGKGALVSLPALITLLMKNVKEIQSNSLLFLDKIEDFSFYKLKKIGTRVMSKNKSLKKIMAPLLEKIGSCSVSENPNLADVCFLSLKTVGTKALCSNNNLKLLVLEEVQTVGAGAISLNENLSVLLMNGLQTIGLNAFYMNPNLKWIEFESLNELVHCNCFYKTHSDCRCFVPNLNQGKMILKMLIGKNALSTYKRVRQKEE